MPDKMHDFAIDINVNIDRDDDDDDISGSVFLGDTKSHKGDSLRNVQSAQGTLVINDRREAFCQALASGMHHNKAYEVAGYTTKEKGASNAGRLAAHPVIIARVKEIQNIAVTERMAQQRAEELLLKRMEREKLYNLDWVLLTAKDIMMAAQSASKYKDALNALGFISDLLGYTNNPDAKKKDANKREPNDPDNHTNVPQVNVSILNQIAKRLDDSLGNRGEERPTITLEPEESS